MTEATILLLNMRGGCATVGDQVHALFRVNNRHSLVRQGDQTDRDGSRNAEAGNPDCLAVPTRAP